MAMMCEPVLTSGDAIKKYRKFMQISQLSMRAHWLAECIYAEVRPSYCGGFRNPEEELVIIEE